MIDIDVTAKPQETVNKFELTGSVVRKYRPGPEVIILSFGLNGHEADKAIYPNVVFYGADVADRIDKSVKLEKGNYPRMRVTGIIQTHRQLVDDKAKFYQDLVGQTLTAMPTKMEMMTGIKGIGKRKADSENAVCLLGEVSRIFPITRPERAEPLGVIVTVRIPGERMNYPRMTCFSHLIPTAAGLKRGDVVCMTGTVQTSYRDRNGEREHYTSIVADELYVVSRATDDRPENEDLPDEPADETEVAEAPVPKPKTRARTKAAQPTDQ